MQYRLTEKPYTSCPAAFWKEYLAIAANPPCMSILTWIHLSDWHCGEADDSTQQDVIREALIEDVEYRLKRTYTYEQKNGRGPIDFRIDGPADFLFFSGDATFRGKRENYTGAKQLIEGVRNAAGVPQDRVFLTPGNHDLERSAIKDLPAKLQEPLSPADEGDRLDPSPSEVEELRRPFTGFREFSAPYAFGGEEVVAMRSGTLASEIDWTVSAFNTALYCGRQRRQGDRMVSNDYGGLIVAQREKALPESPEASLCEPRPHLKIAMIHHPFHWLHPAIQPEVQNDLIRNFHFLLMGHEHQPRLNWISQGAGEALYIPAGATFLQDRGSATRTARQPHEMGIAYNIVHIDFKQKRACVILRLYRYGSRDNKLKFHSDNRDNIGWPTGLFLLDRLPGCPHTEFPRQGDRTLIAHGTTARLLTNPAEASGLPVLTSLPALPLRPVETESSLETSFDTPGDS